MSTDTASPIGIGSPVWRFDINRRVYTKTNPGQKWTGGRLVWREHWAPHTVTSETSRSWVCGTNRYDQFKIPKRGKVPRGIILSERELDEACWINDNQIALSERVRNCAEYSTLRRIAEIVGCEEKRA